MNRLAFALALTAATGFAQTPAANPSDANQPAPAVAAAATSSSSHISHVVAGPDGRVQGMLLRNGTYVTLSPALSQQVPSTLRHHASVTVSGPAYGSGSDRTIQAQQLTIAGVAYNDAGGVVGPGAMPAQPLAGAGPAAPPRPPAGAPGAAPPPPPPAGPGAPPPPPPPCANGPMPPAPGARPAGNAPPPPANGNVPAPPAPAGAAPVGQAAPTAQPVPQAAPSAQN